MDPTHISLLLMLAVFSFAVNGDELKIIPDQATLWAIEPEPVELKCEHIGGTAPANLHFVQVPEVGDPIHTNTLGFKQTLKSKTSADGTVTTSTLKIELENSRIALSGTYKCISEPLEKDISLKVVKVEPQNGLLEKDEKPVTLGCDITGVDVKDVTSVWHKNGVPLDEMPNAPSKYSYGNDSLSVTIMKPVVQDAGQYSCNITFDQDGSSQKQDNQIVEFYAKPVAEMKDKKSRNLAQEATLLLKCNIFGYPTPNVTWLKDSQELDPIKDRRISIKSHGAIPISELHIVELDFADRGDYACEVSSEKFPNYTMKATLLIRVKDKLAALWPFLGTVAEVIILCIIIFICEKRKSKEIEDNADGATDNAENAKGSSIGKDDVRQRNVTT